MHIHIHRPAGAHTIAYAHIRTHAHTHTHLHTSTSQGHAMSLFAHVCRYVRAHTHTHTHTHTHKAHTHTYTHKAHRHIHKYSCNCSGNSSSSADSSSTERKSSNSSQSSITSLKDLGWGTKASRSSRIWGRSQPPSPQKGLTKHDVQSRPVVGSTLSSQVSHDSSTSSRMTCSTHFTNDSSTSSSRMAPSCDSSNSSKYGLQQPIGPSNDEASAAKGKAAHGSQAKEPDCRFTQSSPQLLSRPGQNQQQQQQQQQQHSLLDSQALMQHSERGPIAASVSSYSAQPSPLAASSCTAGGGCPTHLCSPSSTSSSQATPCLSSPYFCTGPHTPSLAAPSGCGAGAEEAAVASKGFDVVKEGDLTSKSPQTQAWLHLPPVSGPSSQQVRGYGVFQVP